METFKGFGASITPFAKRTRQLLNERFGTVEDKTELPQEYLELEKRIDNLKATHLKLLNVTGTFANESYDYQDLKESFVDLGKTIQEKVANISSAASAAEAQAALTKPVTKAPPKTLNHALARASLAGSELLGSQDHFGNALAKYSAAEEKIGNARLAQDNQITSRFNSAMSTTVNSHISFAMKARRNVQNARLTLDAAKSSAKNARPERQDAARVEVEQAEDAFVAAVEEATSVMKNVLDTPEPLRNLADMIAAQLVYHKEAYEILAELAPTIDQLQVESEAAYRSSRGGS